MVRTIFWGEATGRGADGDGFLEREELRRYSDINEEDSCAIEDAECAKTDGNGRLPQLAKAGNYALVLLRCGAAEKLQSDVPGFGFGPAQGVWRIRTSSSGLEQLYRGGEVVCRGGG